MAHMYYLSALSHLETICKLFDIILLPQFLSNSKHLSLNDFPFL